MQDSLVRSPLPWQALTGWVALSSLTASLLIARRTLHRQQVYPSRPVRHEAFYLHNPKDHQNTQALPQRQRGGGEVGKSLQNEH